MGIYIKGMSIDDGLYQIANGKIFKYSSKGKPTKQYDVVEVRRPHKVHFYKRRVGRWIEDTEQSAKHIEKIYFCSNCGDFEAWGETELYNYCPNCGAKMESEI